MPESLRARRIPIGFVRATVGANGGSAMNKDVKGFVRRLERAGLVVERSGGGHYRVRTPEGATIAFVPFSPSTNRWRENTIAQLRQRGIELED